MAMRVVLVVVGIGLPLVDVCSGARRSGGGKREYT